MLFSKLSPISEFPYHLGLSRYQASIRCEYEQIKAFMEKIVTVDWTTGKLFEPAPRLGKRCPNFF